ncbi:hypothetical protein [Ruegeria sp. HKCCD6428]|uniref:hypothetical protein n=1 Tax=Ruegeria sp. HKCCD6428 TaxID=2683002 RepID=UPI0014912C16|nr:hypothetical protein [Ruegeria sp. HKCCD6428]NOC82173.1 hypothetical protein [Ruegeria sp. HKCCD6428]
MGQAQCFDLSGHASGKPKRQVGVWDLRVAQLGLPEQVFDIRPTAFVTTSDGHQILLSLCRNSLVRPQNFEDEIGEKMLAQNSDVCTRLEDAAIWLEQLQEGFVGDPKR